MATAAADMEQMLGMAPSQAEMSGIGSLPTAQGPEMEMEADDSMMETGIGSAVQRLQSLGRGGDELIAHLTPGEIVVPTDVLKQNPQVQEMIFAELRLMGVEDPERYIVGSEANSINPETGMPEFLGNFIKKAVRGVKNAVKSVAKVVKKVAPIVLPIALAMTPLGPIYGAALGSGIGTLAQGGSLKDAFKSALISGAMGGVSAGIGSKLSGGTFTGGVSDAFSNAGARFAQTGQALSAGKPFQSFVDPTQAAQAATTGPQGTPVQDTVVGPQNATPDTTAQQLLDAQTGGFTNPQAAQEAALRTAQTGVPAPVTQAQADVLTQGATASAPRTTLQTAGDYMFRGGQTPAEIAAAQQAAGQSYMASTPSQFQTAAGYEAAKASAGPGILTRFGPSVAAGTALAYGAGFFDTPPPPEPYDEFAGQTRYLDMTPEERKQYQISDLSGGPAYDQPYTQQSQYGLRFPGQYYSPYYQPRYAAAGGEMTAYPRMNGAISGPGTETSDDVPAMLSDGEFVMTAKAVRGAGNGSRERGIKTMYDMMSRFERAVA